MICSYHLETVLSAWDLFNTTYRAMVPVVCNQVMLCGAAANDSKLAINMALTQASLHGAAAAVCIDSTPDQVIGPRNGGGGDGKEPQQQQNKQHQEQQHTAAQPQPQQQRHAAAQPQQHHHHARQLRLPSDLAAIGFSIAKDSRGQYPQTQAGNEMVNAAVLALLLSDRSSPAPVLSNTSLGINRGHLYGTREFGFDYFVSERMAVFILDSSGACNAVYDFASTQSAILSMQVSLPPHPPPPPATSFFFFFFLVIL